jgi:uncharacterized protein YeeX (DUF496 family)
MKFWKWLKNKEELVKENRTLRKKYNTIQLENEVLKDKLIASYESKYNFAEMYQDQLEKNKELSKEKREIKKELAEVKEV